MSQREQEDLYKVNPSLKTPFKHESVCNLENCFSPDKLTECSELAAHRGELGSSCRVESPLLPIQTLPQTNQCGKQFNNQKCDVADHNGGPCCSSFGWCGEGHQYCGTGCQGEFSVDGHCNHKQEKPKDGQSKPGTHSGKPDDNNADTDVNVAEHIFPTKESKTGGRCGKEQDTICAPGLCCSGAGYCGKTGEYCSVPGNCQESYGWCDSFVVPKGYDVSKDKRRINSHIPAYIKQCSVPGTLALSFDDGPSQYTEQVLDVLKEFKARATFFLGGILNGRGSIDKNWARVLRRMVTEGHQIGSHTWSHPDLDSLTSSERKNQMFKNERAIANVIGKYPTFVRAPMTRCADECRKDMKNLGYHVTDWQFDSEDWKPKKPSVDTVISRLTSYLENAGQHGSMFLIQHDTHEDAAKVTRALLQNKRGDWKAVPLVECLGHPLEDAFRFPRYLEYDGTAKDGCLFAASEFCYKPDPFTNASGCKENSQKLIGVHQVCLDSSTKVTGKKVCDVVDKVQRQLDHYCHECGKQGCDWTHVKVKT
ncbi:hypothetical protein H2198_007062 [Neophaeococcomyces mojaviensis]|uniref:Uncharacterized protein n=1 Tax=Neophaeococcomyces mojaviensis TaxID=3383035 RepID=A0ACC3A1N3_9EURO|nr:hypothetical protein H2198_007062 [Knufia sp. JES_112]